MIRIGLVLVFAALLAATTGWFSSEPGTLTFTFRGWRVDSTVAVAVAVLAVLVLAILVLYSLMTSIAAAPRRVRAWRARRRTESGLAALTRGMVAVAAGDPAGARRAARRAEALFANTPLTMLLSAQAAQLEGDERAAEKYFTAMLARPETEFLGLRGLLVQAGRAGNDAQALAYVKRASELRPDAPWVLTSRFELAVKAGLWDEAEAALRRAVRRGAVGKAEGRRRRAVLLVEQSRDAESRDFTVEARNLATAARRADPGFVPAVVRFARLAGANGDTRAARRSLERAWAAGPHPELAAVALDLVTDEGEAGALARVRAAESFAKARPEDPLSHITVAEAALDANLWGEARTRLGRALAGAEAAGEAPSARVCRLMARLEEEERSDHATAHAWRARLGDAPPEARWLCGNCDAGFAAWSALCPDCRAFASLCWNVPEGVTILNATTATLAPGTKPKSEPTPVGAGERED